MFWTKDTLPSPPHSPPQYNPLYWEALRLSLHHHHGYKTGCCGNNIPPWVSKEKMLIVMRRLRCITSIGRVTVAAPCKAVWMTVCRSVNTYEARTDWPTINFVYVLVKWLYTNNHLYKACGNCYNLIMSTAAADVCVILVCASVFISYPVMCGRVCKIGMTHSMHCSV